MIVVGVIPGSLLGAEPRTEEMPERLSGYLGVSVLEDDNLFRSPADEVSETRMRLTGGLSAELEMGQQELLLDGRVHRNEFDQFDQLDYTGGRANAALNWKIGTTLLGTIDYGYRRDLTDFRDIRALRKDLTTRQETGATAAYFLTPGLQVRAGLGGIDIEHSDDLLRDIELREWRYEAAVLFRTRPGSFLGFGSTLLRGEYPNRDFQPGSVVDEQYDQLEHEVIFEWRPSPRTSLDARVGYTERTQDNLPERDFDAFTGELSLQYRFSPKTRLALTAIRDVQSIDERDVQSAAVNLLEVIPTWNVTETLTLSGRAVYSRRDFEGPDPVIGDEREDDSYFVETTLSYLFWSRLLVDISLRYDSRDSNRPDVEYDAWQARVGLGVTF
jgi:hypothetical protein